MSYRGKKDVRVYNECPFQVNLVGQRRDYIFPPCIDGEPTMNFVDFEEIEYAHSRGKVFNIGLLIFAEDDREGMYEALGIRNWQDKVWFNDDIKDIIMHPTVEKMQRVIDVKDLITFERIRGMMVRFMNEKRDVSQNVINLVNARYRELNAGVSSSKIVIRPADIEATVSADEVADLKKQLADMQELVKKLAKEKLSISNSASDVEANNGDYKDESEVNVTSPKRSTRRTTVKK
jgi:hypothetical protein